MPTNALDTLDYANALYKDGVLSEYTATTPTGRMSFKLEHLISYFDLDTQTHRAIDDVRQNVIVYKRLQELEKTKDYGFWKEDNMDIEKMKERLAELKGLTNSMVSTGKELTEKEQELLFDYYNEILKIQENLDAAK